MGFSNSPNKATAQTLSDIHEKIQSGQGVDWSDYSDIRHLQNDTIPKTLQYLEGEIDRIEKIPVTTKYTQEMKDADKQEWEKYKQSIETLRKSWQDGKITIENQREEVYGKTKELVSGKLKELLEDIITERPKTPEAPVQGVIGNNPTPTANDIPTTQNVPPNTPAVRTASPQKTKPPRKSVTQKGERPINKPAIKKSPLEKGYSFPNLPNYIDVKGIKHDPQKSTVDFPFKNVINATDNKKIDSLQYPLNNLNQPSGEKTITDVLIGNVFYKSISIKHKIQDGKIIFGYSEVKEDFAQQSARIETIRERVSRASDLRYLTAKSGDNQYFRNQTSKEVEYAIINQGPGIEIIYDMPNNKNIRNIYVLRGGNVTGIIKIDNNNTIKEERGEKIRNIGYTVQIPRRPTN